MSVTKEDFKKIVEKLSSLLEGDELVITLAVLTQRFDDGVKDEMSFVILLNFLERDKEFLQYTRTFTAATGNRDSISQAVKEMTDCFRLQRNNSHRDSSGLSLDAVPTMTTLLTSGLAKALYSLPCELHAEILSKFPKIWISGDIINIESCLNSSMNALGITGKHAPVVLAMVYVSYEVLRAIYKWWTGEYSVERCTQIILTSIAAMAAGYGGCVLGMCLASKAGTYGMLVAGALGGVVAGVAGAKIAEYSTLWFFDLPRDIAVEKAYQFLGLTKSATNREINESFENLCKEYDPRRPSGSKEKYLDLQIHMGKIKVARGERFD